MTDAPINTDNVFDNEDAMPNFPEVAYDLADELKEEAVIVAVGFSSLLWEVLTDEQKRRLSEWERAALERLHELGDDTGLEDVGLKLRA